MVALRASFADLYSKDFDKIHVTTLMKLDPIYPKISMVETDNSYYVKKSGISGTGYLPSKNEGSAISSDDIYQGYDKTFTHTTYSMLVRCSYEAWQDDRTGSLKKIPNFLARSAVGTMDYRQGVDVFDMSQTTALADGKVLCATDHPRPDGGTAQSNRPTSNADISITALEAGIVAGGSLLDYRGLPMPIKFDTLMICPGDEITTRKLLETKEMPGGAQNDKNIVNTYGLRLIVNPYLTDTDSWYLMATGADINQNYFIVREAPNSLTKNDDTTDDGLYQVRCRFSCGPTDWRWVYGSTGGA